MRFSMLTLLTLLLVVTVSLPTLAQEEVAEAPAQLTITGIEVTPAKPAVDTLCQLRARLKNDGDRIASQLAFEVSVEGHELIVYGNQIFMERLDPGEETEVRLYNFWSTETGRPAPTDGTFDVVVSLTEAHWYTIVDEEDAEVWTPLEPVTGLPSTATVKLPMAPSTP